MRACSSLYVFTNAVYLPTKTAMLKSLVSVVTFLFLSSTDTSAQPPPKLFRATGTHQCQSATDIGHSCKVIGNGYTSCDEAARDLAGNDCCPTTRKKVDGKERYGGTSIGFSINSCTAV